MATNNPVTVAMSAPATPGAMAVRLAACALAMPENVSITPQTVPSRPMNGPPATAVDSTTIQFSRASACALTSRSSAPFTDANDEALILVGAPREKMSVSISCAAEGRALEWDLTTDRTSTGLFFNWYANSSTPVAYTSYPGAPGYSSFRFAMSNGSRD